MTPDMTEQDGEAIIGPAKIPTTGSRGQPLKMALYLEEATKLMEVVNAYRAAKGGEATIGPAEAEASVEGEALLQSGPPAVSIVNKTPTPTKRKSYPLPPLDRPSEIPGFPLRDPAGQDIPDYGSIGRLKAIRATQADRRGKRAPLTPSGPSRLVKRHDVRAWKVAE